LQHQYSSFIINTAIIIFIFNSSVKRHNGGNNTVYLFYGLFFVRFDISGGVRSDKNVVHRPAQNGMSAMGDFFLQRQLHQLLGRRAHILKALSKGNYGKTEPFEVLHHLHSYPAVKCDLADIVAFAQFLNESLNESVMHNVALGGHYIPLFFPKIVLHIIAPDAQADVVFRHPEKRQDCVFVRFILRREHQHKSGNISGGGEVKPSVADSSRKTRRIHQESAGIPFRHRHPADGLLYPLVQAQLPEAVFLGWFLLR